MPTIKLLLLKRFPSYTELAKGSIHVLSIDGVFLTWPVRPRAVVLLSSEPCAASEKVKLWKLHVIPKKNKRLLAVY